MDRIITTNLSNEEAVTLYNEILTDLSGDNKSYSAISKEIDNTRTKINSLSNQQDKDILLACLETGFCPFSPSITPHFYYPQSNFET